MRTGELVRDSVACTTASAVRYPRIFLPKVVKPPRKRAATSGGNSSLISVGVTPGW